MDQLVKKGPKPILKFFAYYDEYDKIEHTMGLKRGEAYCDTTLDGGSCKADITNVEVDHVTDDCDLVGDCRSCGGRGGFRTIRLSRAIPEHREYIDGCLSNENKNVNQSI